MEHARNNIRSHVNTTSRKFTVSLQRRIRDRTGVSVNGQTTSLVRSNDIVVVSNSADTFSILPCLTRRGSLVIVAGKTGATVTLKHVNVGGFYANNRVVGRAVTCIKHRTRSVVHKVCTSILLFSTQNLALSKSFASSSVRRGGLHHIVVAHTTERIVVLSDDGVNGHCLSILYQIKSIASVLYRTPLPGTVLRLRGKWGYCIRTVSYCFCSFFLRRRGGFSVMNSMGPIRRRKHFVGYDRMAALCMRRIGNQSSCDNLCPGIGTVNSNPLTAIGRTLVHVHRLERTNC